MPRSCRALAVVLIASAAVAVGGCGTYLPPAPLDDAERAELESLRVALAERTILVVDLPKDHSVSDVLRNERFNVRAVPADDPAVGPRVVVTGTTGGGFRNPWATIFGLFVIPVWKDAFAYELRVSDGAREIPCECIDGVPKVYGWLALPLLVLPRWRTWHQYLPWGGHAGTLSRRMALTIARSLVAAAEPE